LLQTPFTHHPSRRDAPICRGQNRRQSASLKADLVEDIRRVNLGNWQLDTVDGGLLSLDGGVLFGIVPKMVWQNVVAADSSNRVKVRNSCVLARDGHNTVLIDTGYGGKHVPLDKNFYQMEEGAPVCRSLADLGVHPEEIDAVVFTHL